MKLIRRAWALKTFGGMSLVTTSEAAQILGVTPVRVRQLIKEKRLTAEKHGRDHLSQDREPAATATTSPAPGPEPELNFEE